MVEYQVQYQIPSPTGTRYLFPQWVPGTMYHVPCYWYGYYTVNCSFLLLFPTNSTLFHIINSHFSSEQKYTESHWLSLLGRFDSFNPATMSLNLTAYCDLQDNSNSAECALFAAFTSVSSSLMFCLHGTRPCDLFRFWNAAPSWFWAVLKGCDWISRNKKSEVLVGPSWSILTAM